MTAIFVARKQASLADRDGRQDAAFRQRASGQSGDKAALLAELRGRIARVTGPRLSSDEVLQQARTASLGEPRLDAAMPWGGLLRGGLHEVGAAAYRDSPAALGFGAALVARLARPETDKKPGGMVLWCRPARAAGEFGNLYGPGLAAFGFDPDRLIVVNARTGRDVLWALEEGLKCTALSAVVGEVPGDGNLLDLAASRRLQLAAEASGVSAVLLRGHLPPETDASAATHMISALGASGASAALTRWRISAAPSALTEGYAGIGLPRWQVELIRCRGGRPRDWLLEWDHAENYFTVAAPVANRPSAPRSPFNRGLGTRSGEPRFNPAIFPGQTLSGQSAEPLRRTG